ncbi:MAG: c-type cytochrome [Hyphomicrobiaceae bacterium]
MRIAAIAACFATFLAVIPAALANEGDAKEGEEVFRSRCRQCHQVGPEAKNALGPVLNGVIGRKAGTIEGFSYSPANKKAGDEGWVWTPEQLLKYLENPREAMPGNRMAFVGLKDEQDRKDLLAYLKTFSK